MMAAVWESQTSATSPELLQHDPKPRGARLSALDGVLTEEEGSCLLFSWAHNPPSLQTWVGWLGHGFHSPTSVPPEL